MEDIVAFMVRDTKEGVVAFLTWGRVFHPTDASHLEEAIANNLSMFGLTHVTKIRVCDSLLEVRDHQFFYERFFSMSQKQIPLGKTTYLPWRKKMQRRIRCGKELYHIEAKIKAIVGSK